MKNKPLLIMLSFLIFSLAACGWKEAEIETTAIQTEESTEDKKETEAVIDRTIDSVLAFDEADNETIFYSVKAYNSSKEVIWEYETPKVQKSINPPFFNYCRFAGAGQIVVFFQNRLISLDVNTGEKLWEAGIEADYCEMLGVGEILYVCSSYGMTTYMFNSSGSIIGSADGDEIPRNFDRPFEEEEEEEEEQTAEAEKESKKAIADSSESGSNYKEAYKKVLKHFEKQIQTGEGWDDPRTEYVLYDLNSDDLPELIVGFGSREKTSNYYIYTFVEGKAKLISGKTDVYDEDDEYAIGGRDDLYGARDKGVIASISMKGYESASLYSMSGMSIKEEELFFGPIIGGDGNYDWQELELFDFDDMSGLDWTGNPEYDNYKAMENLIKLHAAD